MNPVAEGQSPAAVPSPTHIGTPEAPTQPLSAAPLVNEASQMPVSPAMQDSTSQLSSVPGLGETTMPPQFIAQQASETGAAFSMAAEAGIPSIEVPPRAPQEANASVFTQDANTALDTDKPVTPMTGGDMSGPSQDALVGSQIGVVDSPVVTDVGDKVDRWMNTNNIPTVIPPEKIASQVGNYLDKQSASLNPVKSDFSKTYDEKPDTVGVAYADLAAFITQEAQAKADALKDALESPQGQIVKAALDRYYGSKLPPAASTPAPTNNS